MSPESEAMSTKSTPEEEPETWSKNERRILHLFAVLGMVNLLIYLVTQNSYIMQNIYWVYGIITGIDAICFLGTLALWEDSKRHYHPNMTPRFRNGLIAMGLWLMSIPVVILSYFLPSISVSWMDVLNYIWGASLVASGFYDISYVIVVVGCWLSEGVSL
jgi:uncharacterized membrane-anchored protein